MASQKEDVYATLLLSDTYLPGALVLAHSLRDAGTTKKLAVLVTEDSVSADAIAQLRTAYDYIIPTERVRNESPANLYLMNRGDLHSTFTKINLWKQLQFGRIVYIDADIVALRAPDELFALPHAFSAAPDIGWPDIFNTGLMVLNPNMGDYYALLAMAQRGISFDGADQGLLNMHFKNTFNRLSFTYNVTPSAHYQYLPAYKHFQSSISMAHFIGPEKPWTQGREASKGSSPYDELIGRWWAVYDRHYRESSLNSTTPTLVQYYTKGEYQPVIPIISRGESYQPKEIESEIPYPTAEVPLHDLPLHDVLPDVPVHHEAAETEQAGETHVPPLESKEIESKEKEAEPIQQFSSWDASKAPPPADSLPEASNFPATHYTMSSDATPFKAPVRYPDPPKNMYYEVPKTPTYQKPAPIFPWEKNPPKPTRVFPEDNVEATEQSSSSIESGAKSEIPEPITPVTPTTPTISFTPADPWQTYTRSNAWDDDPAIERYIGNLQRSRKGHTQVLKGFSSADAEVSSPGAVRKHGMRLTDFPTEFERPSLPVTPAPIRRPSFWGEEKDAEGEFPAAEGVPSQEEWDPAAQLEQLARRQSDVLQHKLGGIEQTREIPTRGLPFGSENVVSPTYVAPNGPKLSESTTNLGTEEPSYNGPGVVWEKDEGFLQQLTPEPGTEAEKDVLET